MAWITLQLELETDPYRQLEPLLTRLSPDGMQVEDDDTLGGLPLAPNSVRLTLYVQPEKVEATIAHLQAALAHLEELPTIAVAPLQEQDWNATWRAHFKSLEIGRHLRVEPAWDRKPPSSDRHTLLLDPGLAFGTGTHETTQLAYRLLEAWADEAQTSERDLHEIDLLDVGTGSAILSMGAMLLGFGHATGTEIDPDALDNARDHLTLNGLDSGRVTLLELADPNALAPRQWELVLANIISSVLLRIRDALLARTEPGGTLIISGVLAEEGTVFLNKFMGKELILERQERQKEWLGFVFTRRP